eukprot:SAG25_NODE_1133_length_3837_cov_10.869984_1_plen_77_part_10
MATALEEAGASSDEEPEVAPKKLFEPEPEDDMPDLISQSSDEEEEEEEDGAGVGIDEELGVGSPTAKDVTNFVKELD